MTGNPEVFLVQNPQPTTGVSDFEFPKSFRMDDTDGWVVISGKDCRVILEPFGSLRTEGRGALKVSVNTRENCATRFVGIETILDPPLPYDSSNHKYLALDFFATIPNLTFPYRSPGSLQVRYLGSNSYESVPFKRAAEKTWRCSYQSDMWYTTVLPLKEKGAIQSVRIMFLPEVLPKNVPVSFLLDNLRFVNELPPDPDFPVNNDLDSKYTRAIREVLVKKNITPNLNITGDREYRCLMEHENVHIPPGKEISLSFTYVKKDGNLPAVLLFLDGCRLDGQMAKDTWGEYALYISLNGKTVEQNAQLKFKDWSTIRHPINGLEMRSKYDKHHQCWFVETSNIPLPFFDKQGDVLLGEVRAKAWGDFYNEHRTNAFQVGSFVKPGENILRIRNKSQNETLVIERIGLVSNPTGIILFSREIDDPIYPWTIPSWKEVSNKISLRGAKDEFVVLGLGLLSLISEKNVSIKVTTLHSDNFEIDNSLIRLFAVQYSRETWLSARHQFAPLFLRGYVPNRLVELTPEMFLPVPPQLCQAYWLQIYIPKDALPGNYSGKLHLHIESGSSYSIPLKLQVLPFELKEPDNIAYGIWLMDRYDPVTQQGQKLIKDVHEHGIDIINIGPFPRYAPENPKASQADVEKLMTNLKAVKSLGLKGPFFVWTEITSTQISNRTGAKPGTPEFGEKFEPLVRMCVEADLNRDLIFFPMDEPNSPDARKVCEALCRHIKNAGGRTMTTLTPSTYYALYDVLDLASINAAPLFSFYKELLQGHPSQDANFKQQGFEETTTKSQEGPTKKWLLENMNSYYFGPGDGACVMAIRVVPGILSWRMKEMKSLLWWAYSYRDRAYMGARNDDGSYDPRPGWEGFRQGVQDYRYLSTLLTYLQRRLPRVQALSEVNNLLPAPKTQVTTEHPTGGLSPEDFKEFRNRIVRKILDELGENP